MNEIIVDKTHKENISYIGINNQVKANTDNESVTLNDMYNFVKDDLSLASYTQITEEEEEDYIPDPNIDFLDAAFFESMSNSSPAYKEIELGLIGQDLKDSTNAVKDLVVDTNKAKKYNIALTCNQNNYINVLAGALKYAIHEIETLKNQLNNK